MEATAERSPRWTPTIDRTTVEPAIAWLLPFLLIVYLALSGGGYDLVARSEIGVVVWWMLLLGVLAGALPRARIGRTTWLAAAPLVLFLIWTWLAAGWSQSEERTLAEVARVATYLGLFVAGACLVSAGSSRALLNGIAAGITVVCGLAVLSRLTPSLFPNDSASQFYATTRLRYPFDYSDGVGEFAALGVPLLLFVATGARTIVGRALGAAGLPLVLLCLALTVSRGGILAAVVGLIVFIVLAEDRIPRLVTVGFAAVSTAVLMLALLDRPGLRDRLTGVAPAGQRHSMLAILIVVGLAMAVTQTGFVLLARRRARPHWARGSRRGAQLVGAGLLAMVAIGIVVVIATGTDHRLWNQFKEPNPPASGNTYFRLLSVAGSHRYQYWHAATSAFNTAPVKGIGPGTFEFWWSQHNSLSEFVRNAHSLYLETLAEAGLVGLALILAFFGFVLGAGSRRTLRAVPEIRIQTAAAVAGVAAFCAAAAFDWIWQIGIVPMIAMLLAAVAVAPLAADGGGAAGPSSGGKRSLPPWLRSKLAPALAALVALYAIGIPLASTVAVRKSQSKARRGDATGALNEAKTAQALEPGAATPRLQRALVLEQLDDIPGANAAILQAEAREATNWRIWLTASRIETEANHPAVALADYQRAKALNPHSPLFNHGARPDPGPPLADMPIIGEVRRMRWAIICVISATAVTVPPASRAVTLTPPGKAGADQYFETVPSDSGNAAPPALNGTSPTASPSLDRIGSGRAGAVALAKLGTAGQAAAALAAATAPAAPVITGRVISDNGQAITPTPHTDGSGSAAGGLTRALTGSDSGGIGFVLPLLLVLSLVVAVVAGARRARDGRTVDG